jgi:UDP-N-acetyl-D-mannosaminuronic acid transferase (WecB/TagA/CpsF family)
MNAILASLSHDRKHTIESIINHYEAHQSVIVNFLYFANAMKYRLLEYARNDREHAYRQSLVSGDFLLPDGIALQLYRRAADGTRVDNMNGTDMTPDLLHVLCDRGSVSLYIYSVYDPTIGKNQSRLDRGLSELMLQFPQVRIAASYQSIYSDRGIDFPHDKRESMVARDDADYKVFLHGTGSPFQEIWSYAQREWLIQQ